MIDYDYGDEPPRTNGPPPWIITFADLMVLLMCFFVLMLSFSEMDVAKFKLMSGSLTQAFGVQTEVTADDPPKGTSLEATEFAPGMPDADGRERGSPAHRRLRSRTRSTSVSSCA